MCAWTRGDGARMAVASRGTRCARAGAAQRRVSLDRDDRRRRTSCPLPRAKEPKRRCSVTRSLLCLTSGASRMQETRGMRAWKSGAVAGRPYLRRQQQRPCSQSVSQSRHTPNRTNPSPQTATARQSAERASAPLALADRSRTLLLPTRLTTHEACDSYFRDSSSHTDPERACINHIRC